MTPTVALTYDDGPDRVWTPRLLAALRVGGARATFFVQVRRAVAHRELLAEMVAELALASDRLVCERVVPLERACRQVQRPGHRLEHVRLEMAQQAERLG